MGLEHHLGEISDKCFIFIPSRLDTEYVALKLQAFFVDWSQGQMTPCEVQLGASETLSYWDVKFVSLSLISLICVDLYRFSADAVTPHPARWTSPKHSDRSHTSHLYLCCVECVVQWTGNLQREIEMLSKCVGCASDAVMFVFQELRDDMASILADVFCILGKSAPANDD